VGVAETRLWSKNFPKNGVYISLNNLKGKIPSQKSFSGVKKDNQLK
jgi:hypothetical protein